MPEYKNCPLPSKPSELIRVALADLTKVERDKKYVVNMGSWHEPVSSPYRRDGGIGTTCAVCFAGSVMAKTCDVDPTTGVVPGFWPERTERKFSALNSLRMGYVRTGVMTMIGHNAFGRLSAKKFGELEKIDKDTWVPAYDSRDPKPFKLAMRKIVRKLERIGL